MNWKKTVLVYVVSFLMLLSAQTNTAAQKTKGTTPFSDKAVPVILIHGIGGSNLRQPLPTGNVKGFSDDGGFPNDVAVGLRGDPEKIEFDSRGEPRTDTKSKTVIAAGFYDVFRSKDITDLSKFLKKRGYVLNRSLFEFAYDFRYSAEYNAAKLGELIDSIKKTTNAEQVDIIGHSMGGLVAKVYLADELHQPNVRKLIFVGTPHLGAPKALKALRYGDDLEVALIDKCKLKRAVRNYPGMYNLLPGKRYFEAMKANGAKPTGYFYDEDDLDGDTVRGLLDYEQTVFNLKNGKETVCPLKPEIDVMKNDIAMPLDRLNANMVDRDVVKFHETFDDWKKPEKVMVYNLVGYGVETLESVKEAAGKVTFGYTTEGDGTVPLWSAETAASDFIYYINFGKLKTEHAAMIGDDRIDLQIYELLNKGAGIYTAETQITRPATDGFMLKTRAFVK